MHVVPGQPSISVNSTTVTTISLSWSVPSGSVVTSYVVMWQRDTSVCSGDDDGSMSVTTTSVSTSRNITVQEEDSSYSITVTATNAAGSSAPTIAVTAVTGEAGYYFLPLSTVFHDHKFKGRGCVTRRVTRMRSLTQLSRALARRLLGGVLCRFIFIYKLFLSSSSVCSHYRLRGGL